MNIIATALLIGAIVTVIVVIIGAALYWIDRSIERLWSL